LGVITFLSFLVCLILHLQTCKDARIIKTKIKN
jgi:hypothetical protein